MLQAASAGEHVPPSLLTLHCKLAGPDGKVACCPKIMLFFN